MIYVPRSQEENKAMADWAAKIIKQEPFAEPYQCLGFTRNNKMACVVVAHDFRWPNCCASFAATDPHWCTRGNLCALADWFFGQLKCARITGIVDPRNERARRLDEWLGFKLEGTLRRARPDGGKLLIYGLIEPDFRFARKRKHVEAKSASAA